MDEPTELLTGHRFFASSDLDEAHTRVARMFCEHRLEPGSDTARGPTIVNHAKLSATSLNWFDYGRPVHIAPVPFDRFFLLQIVLAGTACITDPRREAHVKVGAASIVAPTEQVRMDWSADCAKLVVRVDRPALERFAEQWIGAMLSGPLVFDRVIAWRDASAATLRHTIELMVQDLATGAGVLGNAWAQKRFEEALFSALLLTQPSSLSRALDKGMSPAVPRAVKLAEEYMIANAAQPITMSDLVAASSVSARTLFDNFKRFRGVTPMYYLRRHRLARAREELLRGSEGALVTEIAVRWGFEQLGRFASYYRTVYGEAPSETLRRVR